jgi:hypothetical protein
VGDRAGFAAVANDLIRLYGYDIGCATVNFANTLAEYACRATWGHDDA